MTHSISITSHLRKIYIYSRVFKRLLPSRGSSNKGTTCHVTLGRRLGLSGRHEKRRDGRIPFSFSTPEVLMSLLMGHIGGLDGSEPCFVFSRAHKPITSLGCEASASTSFCRRRTALVGVMANSLTQSNACKWINRPCFAFTPFPHCSKRIHP